MSIGISSLLGGYGPIELSTRDITIPIEQISQFFGVDHPSQTVVTSSIDETGKTVVTIQGPKKSDTAHWAPDPNKENPHVASNPTKAFKVSFLDGTVRTITADDVTDGGDRLTFTGPVEGYSGSRHSVVASLLASQVVEYGLVPVPAEDKTGAYLYRITFKDGTIQDVQADKVYYAKGSEKTNGLFTLVTDLRDGSSRTEFTGTDDLVAKVSRIEPSADVPPQVAPETLVAKTSV